MSAPPQATYEVTYRANYNTPPERQTVKARGVRPDSNKSVVFYDNLDDPWGSVVAYFDHALLVVKKENND